MSDRGPDTRLEVEDRVTGSGRNKLSDDCPFCAIVEERDSLNYVLHRADRTVALLNLAMITPGHTLVVPARHVERLQDLDDHEVAELWATVRLVQAAIASTLDPAGFVYVQNEGVAYVTESHLHVHIVPRYPDDRLRDMWEERPAPDHKELRRIAQALSQPLGGAEATSQGLPPRGG